MQTGCEHTNMRPVVVNGFDHELCMDCEAELLVKLAGAVHDGIVKESKSDVRYDSRGISLYVDVSPAFLIGPLARFRHRRRLRSEALQAVYERFPSFDSAVERLREVDEQLHSLTVQRDAANKHLSDYAGALCIALDALESEVQGIPHHRLAKIVRKLRELQNSAPVPF